MFILGNVNFFNYYLQCYLGIKEDCHGYITPMAWELGEIFTGDSFILVDYSRVPEITGRPLFQEDKFF